MWRRNVGPKIKGYSATVLTLHLLLLKITQNPRYQSITQEYYQSIQELPQNIKASLCWCQKNKHWALAKAMSIVGFGVNYPTAREGTLKILETMQIPVMNFDMEEFMHGPHRTIIKDSYIVLIDTDGCGKILMNNFIDFIKKRCYNAIVIDRYIGQQRGGDKMKNSLFMTAEDIVAVTGMSEAYATN